MLFPNFLLQRIKQIPADLRRDQIPVEVLSGPSRARKVFQKDLKYIDGWSNNLLSAPYILKDFD